MAEDLQGAAVKYLLTIPEVVASVGSFTTSHTPFIFRDEMLVNLEAGEYHSVSAIVVEDGGPYAAPTLTRYRGRRLRINIWANGERDENGNLIGSRSVRIRINDTFKALDRYMHRTDPEPIMWADIQTVSCDRLIDLSEPIAVTDGDGIMLASVYYAVYF